MMRIHLTMVLAMMITFAGSVLAAAGDLDTTFSGDGKLVMNIGSGDSEILGSVLQGDGKIVTACAIQSGSGQYFGVARYNADGSRDMSFGINGFSITPFGTSQFSGANAVALQADGKIVAAGFTTSGPNFSFAVARYNTDGSLDTAFDGDGLVTFDFLGTIDIAAAVAIQGDGRIVVAGRTFNGLEKFAVARLNTDGSLDNSFDGDGKLTTHDFIPSQVGGSSATAVLIQPDQKIVAVGNTTDTVQQIAIARYNTDGSLDSTFSLDGKAFTGHGGSGIGAFASAASAALQTDGKIVIGGFGGTIPVFTVVRMNSDGTVDATQRTTVLAGANVGRSVKIQTDGKIVLAGTTSATSGGGAEDLAIVRFNNDLTLDLTFSGDGKARTDLAGTDIATSLNIQTDGSLVLAGSTSNGLFKRNALARYLTDGTLDTTFDLDGIKIDALGVGASTINDIAVQSDGKIVSVGSVRQNNIDFAVFRTNADGTPDMTFAGTGMVTTDFANGDDVAVAVALQPDGKIIAAGGTGFSWEFARYNPDGSLDSTFDGDGKATLTFFSQFLDQGVKDIVLQPDGKLAVVGYTRPGNFSPLEIRVLRINDVGAQDAASVTADIQPGDDIARAIALQPDGKLVIASNGISDTNQDFAVIRFNTDLTQDNTFSGDGLAFVDFGPGDDIANAITVQPDGKIVVAGPASNGTNTDLGVARLNADGTLDTLFSGDGKATAAIGAGDDVANAVRVQSADGKVIVGGRGEFGVSNDFVLARFTAAGAPDGAFGTAGIVTTDMGSDDKINSVALAPDGKIVVGGESGGNFALARYENDVIEATPTPTATPSATATATATATPTSTPACVNVSMPTLMSHGGPAGVMITIPVNTGDLTGLGVLSADFTFNYDPSVLSPIPANISVTPGTVSPTAQITINATSGGTLIVSAFNTGEFSGAGTVVDLHFKVIGSVGSSTPLALVNFRYNNGSVCSNSANGLLTVVGGMVTGRVSFENEPIPASTVSPTPTPLPVPDTRLDAVGSPSFFVNSDSNGAYTLSGFGGGIYTVTPSRPDEDFLSPNGIFSNDSSRIAQHVVGLITLNAVQLRAADVSGFNSISSFDAALVARWAVGINPPIPVNRTGKWVFTPASTQPDTNIDSVQDYKALLMGDVTGDWMPPLMRPFGYLNVWPDTRSTVTAAVPDLKAVKGSIVSIPLSLDGLQATGVENYQFDLNYDPFVITPADIAASLDGTLGSGFGIAAHSPFPGLLKVFVYGAMPVGGDGIYVYLRFNVTGSAGSSSDMAISGFRLNDASQKIMVRNGVITITMPTTRLNTQAEY